MIILMIYGVKVGDFNEFKHVLMIKIISRTIIHEFENEQYY